MYRIPDVDTVLVVTVTPAVTVQLENIDQGAAAAGAAAAGTILPTPPVRVRRCLELFFKYLREHHLTFRYLHRN